MSKRQPKAFILEREQYAFMAFIKEFGYVERPVTNHEYEIGRFELPNKEGDDPHLLLYKRKSGKYITVVNDDHGLVKRFNNGAHPQPPH
jgi:hypothetical protein